MSPRWHLAYPLSFAVLPALFFAGSSPGLFRPANVVFTCLAVLLPFALLYGVLLLLLRRVMAVESTALVMFGLVLWFYGYADVYRRARIKAPGIPWHALILPIGFLTTLAGVVWLARRPWVRQHATVFLSLMGILLVAVNATSFAVTAARDRLAIGTSRFARELGRSVPAGSIAGRDGAPQRDIFLLILDEHADARTVRAMTGANIAPFQDSLQRLGFTIPRFVHNNYAHTTLSLPSLLNFSHLGELAEEAGRQSRDPAMADHLLDGNRAVRFLREEGYEVVFFPSQWWPATRHMGGTDRELEVWPQLHLAEWASRGLARRVEPHTLLAVSRTGHPADADFIRRTIAAIVRLPAGPRPRFVIAHILSPHEPYVFDRTCGDLPTTSVPTQGYNQQVQCIDHLVLGLVTKLIAQRPVPPIILLQGDHGTGFLGFAAERSAVAVSSEQLRERFGAFGAYFLPEGGATIASSVVTLVNLLPKIFNYYFKTGFPLSGDDLFISVDRAPFDFHRVDPAVLGDVGHSRPGGLAAVQ